MGTGLVPARRNRTMALAASATPAPAKTQPSSIRAPPTATGAGLNRSSAYPMPNPSAYTMGGGTTTPALSAEASAMWLPVGTQAILTPQAAQIGRAHV